jgi:apoptosis-inducing factor 3
VPLDEIGDGAMLAGHAHGKPVLVARRGDELFAVGALCTHYGAPLADGLLVGDTVRCPWHHACFSLRTGDALRAPALNPVPRWEVERRDDQVFVTRELPPPAARSAERSTTDRAVPSSVVIVGGGAAGNAAAEMLRREGYAGPVTIVSADRAPPYDRPNLSKDYLAGTASEDWIPLRTPDDYVEKRIDLLLGRRVTALDTRARRVTLHDGSSLPYGALLLATGAEAVRLPAHFHAGLPVHYLRTLADSRAIIAAAEGATRAVVLGASFIGLEVAAALRTRGVDVHIVSPDARPLEKVLGPELGAFIQQLHEQRGVVFHLARTAGQIDTEAVTLGSGQRLAADFVVAGIGVRPNLALAEGAGLQMDRGVAVNEYLETSLPGVFAAGDIACWPDPHTGDRIRVEHWVVAERQGQAAARNILGRRERLDAVPFFWSNHYDVSLRYVGHAERWDDIVFDGDPMQGDCAASFVASGRTLALATIGRDVASLQAEVAIERGEPAAFGVLAGR